MRQAGKETGSTTLYTAFVQWYQENINSKMTQTPTHRSFGLKLKGMGDFKQKRRQDGVFYDGIALNTTWQRRMIDSALGPDPPHY